MWDLAGTPSFLSAASIAAAVGRQPKAMKKERGKRFGIWTDAARKFPTFQEHPTAYMLFGAIADHMNSESGIAWASLQTLAAAIRRDRRTARRLLPIIEGTGFILTTRRAEEGKASLYIPAFPAVGGADTNVLPPSDNRVLPPSDIGAPGGGTILTPDLSLGTLPEDEEAAGTQQHLHPAPLDWPSVGVAERARLICDLAGLQPTAGLLKSAVHWLPRWERGGITWAAVQLGVLLTVLNAKQPIQSFGYFRREVEKAQAEHVGDEHCDADAIIREFAQQIAAKAAAMEAAA
jgi:hypothetical protein